MKRIALISDNINEGLPYQRLHLPLHHLRHEYEFRNYNVDELGNADAFYFDAMIMCHAYSPPMAALAEKVRYWYGTKLIVDIDDLLHNLPSDHPERRIVPRSHIAHILRAANAAVFSTDYLMQQYGHLVPGKNKCVIGNSFNERMVLGYKPKQKPYKKSFVVGWTGGQSHRSDQMLMVNGLSKFLHAHPHARGYFHVLCPQSLLDAFGAQIFFEESPSMPLDFPATAAAYPFDVCLVPLIDHPFNHGKSDLRLLDMAVNDIVLIASPRSDFVRHKTGNPDTEIMLFADDHDANYMSWNEAITWAHDNPEKLKQMAQRAREYVFGNRSCRSAADKWRTVIDSVLS